MKKKSDEQAASLAGRSQDPGENINQPTLEGEDRGAHSKYIETMRRVAEIPTLLKVASEITGMRLVVVARVTSESWTAISVLDNLNFGLEPGGELEVSTTLCSEVRDGRTPIVIEHAALDPIYCGHPTPKQYGIESYIAVPITLKNGDFFGTLCAIDSSPADLSGKHILPTFELFAGLIAAELDREQSLQALTASEERYKAFISNSTEGIWRFELDTPIPIDLPVDEQIKLAYERGYLAECNDAMARQYGFGSSEQIRGTRLTEFLVADDPKNYEFFKAFLESGYNLTDAEFHEKDANGNDRYFLNNFIGYIENGQLVRAWGSQREITETRNSSITTARLAAIVTSSDDAIISKDLNGIITSWNDAAERIFQYPGDEVIGKSITLLIPPDRLDEETDIITRIRNGESVDHIETMRRRKDGVDIDISVTVSPIRDDAGNIIGASKIARDITEKRRWQESSDQNQLMLTLAMQSSKMGAWEMDNTSGTVWWSEELEDIFGLERGEFEGTEEHFYRLMHKDDRDAAWEEVQTAVAENRSYVIEFRFHHADGNICWMEGRGQAVYSQSGEPVRLYGVGIDISERKKADKALRESEERLRLAVDISQTGTFEIDLLTDDVQTDAIGRRIYGWEPDARLTFTQVQAHFHPDDRDFVMQNVAAAFAPEGSGEFEIEQRIIRTDGETRWIRVFGRAFFEGSGETRRAVRCLGTYIDITEQKQSEETLRLSDERFRLSLSSGAVTVYEQDADLRYKWVFPEAPYRADVIGKTDEELSPGDDAEVRNDLKRRVLKTGESMRAEVAATVKGERHWYDLLIEPRRDESGKVVGIGGTALDITARKKLEASYQESENRFRGLMEQAPFSVQLFDTTGRTIRVNKAWEELWGVTLDQIADYNILEDPQLEIKKIAPLIRRAFDGEAAELPVIEYDPNETIPGKTSHEDPRRWVSAVAYPLKDPDGRVVEVALVHQDISNKVQAEEKVTYQKRLLEALTESVLDGILIVSPKGEMLHFNRQFLDIWDFPAEVLEAKSDRAALNWASQQTTDPDAFLARVSDIYGQPETQFREEMPMTDGRVYERFGAPIYEGENRLGWVWTFRDITERKLVEQTIRESEERLRTMADSIPQLAWMAEPDGFIFWYNRRWYEYTGTTPKEMEGWGWQSVHDVEILPEVMKGWTESIESGEQFEMEFPLLGADGVFRWFLTQVNPLRGSDGKIVRWFGTNTDVDESRQIREALTESEGRYRILAETASDAIIRIDEKSTIQFINSATTRIFGYAPDEMIGQSLTMLMPEELRDNHYAGFNRYLSTGKRNLNWASIEVPGRHKDGRHFPLEISFGEYYDDGRHFFIGIARDITDRKKAGEALLAAERRAAEEYQELLTRIVPLAETLGRARDLVTVYRKVGEFISSSMPCSAFFVSFFNPETRMRTAAYAWGDAGEVDISLLPPIELTDDGGPNSQAVFGRRSVIVNGYMEAMQTRPHVIIGENGIDPMSSVAVPMIVMDRVIGTFEVQAYENNAFGAEHLVALEMASSLAAVAIENVRLIEVEARARIEAESANRAKDEFLSVLSHELRTPLNAMLGWVRMLRSDVLDEASSIKALEVIERNTRLQGSLIEDLLDVSRIISGKMRIETEVTDLHAVIATVSETVESLALAKNIDYSIKSNGENIFLNADPVRLQQVISNLVQNAIKFTHSGGSVTVEAKRSGPWATITIADTGIGIESAFLPHIFDRFSQADGSTKRNFAGLGLGLTIARTIVALHDGEIEVASDGPNRGSVFTVRLPLSGEFYSAAQSLETLVAAGGSKLEGVRILLVDDDEESLIPVKLFLESENATATTAGSAAEALRIFKSAKFDVVISDIGMPGTDGFELIRMIRSFENGGSSVNAIALTAYASPDDREKALAAGYQSHLAKPVSFDELLITLKSFL